MRRAHAFRGGQRLATSRWGLPRDLRGRGERHRVHEVRPPPLRVRLRRGAGSSRGWAQPDSNQRLLPPENVPGWTPGGRGRLRDPGLEIQEQPGQAPLVKGSSPGQIRTAVSGSKGPHDWPLHYGAIVAGGSQRDQVINPAASAERRARDGAQPPSRHLGYAGLLAALLVGQRLPSPKLGAFAYFK